MMSIQKSFKNETSNFTINIELRKKKKIVYIWTRTRDNTLKVKNTKNKTSTRHLIFVKRLFFVVVKLAVSYCSGIVIGLF